MPLKFSKPRNPKVGTGCTVGQGKQIQCIFDPGQFAEIRARALREKTSVAAQIRLLCEWGIAVDNMT